MKASLFSTLCLCLGIAAAELPSLVERAPPACTTTLQSPPPNKATCGDKGKVKNPHVIATSNQGSLNACRDQCIPDGQCLSFSFNTANGKCVTYSLTPAAMNFKTTANGKNAFYSRGCYTVECHCATGQTKCVSTCVNLKTAENNCGSCGTKCPSGGKCKQGTCACPSDSPDTCGSQCVDKDTDPSNCGTCGLSCPYPEDTECSGGACQCSDSSLQLCDSGCVDTTSDSSNCGGCGTTCNTDEKCSGGSCVCKVSGQQTCPNDPSAGCIDFDSSDNHCGNCDTSCTEGQSCTSGTCTCDAPKQDFCGGTCTNYQNDPQNCGGCGNACGDGQDCEGGVCTCTGEGTITCGLNCYSGGTDEDHCGACDTKCDVDDNQTCVDGTCTCPNDNEQICSDGLCHNTKNEEANCGGCGNQCGDGLLCKNGNCQCGDEGPNQCPDQQSCQNGVCKCTDSSTPDECSGGCVDFSSDSNNCGGCGTKCGDNQSCNNGVCKCTGDAAGQTICSDGECHDLSSDNENCQTCGNACPSDQSCEVGVCQCNAGGKTICPNTEGNNPPTICENLNNDNSNCGACGHACDSDQECQPNSEIDTGECVCSNDQETICPDLGCTNLHTSTNHCGSCNYQCGDGQDCEDSQCTCTDSTFNTLCGTTCVDPTSDNDNCGGCGTTCVQGTQCTNSLCAAKPPPDSCSTVTGAGTAAPVYSNYFYGSGNTENPNNPGNKHFPSMTTTFDSDLGPCDAVQSCADYASGLSGTYFSFDLHYLDTMNPKWECVIYFNANDDSSYFNVMNNNAALVYGYSTPK